MDKIEKLLEEIKNDESIWKDKTGRSIEFSSKFLNNVGEIFEKYGFGTTKVYLVNQVGRERSQAFSMQKVLEKMKEYPEIINNRAIGRYIIKTLDTLKKLEV